MFLFEKRDPFPLMPSRQLTPVEKNVHSVAVDLWLGLRVDETEAKLNRIGSRSPAPGSSGYHQNLWFGLAPQDLLTPYVEIREVLERLAPRAGEVVVDLGAAYGRMGFVLARHFPNVRFEGFEFVGERVQEGRRCLEKFGAEKSRLHHADLTSKNFELPKAKFYFIYDFGTDGAIEVVLNQLRRASQENSFTVIARGRRIQYAIDDHHRWLSKTGDASLRTYSVYESSLETATDVA